MPELPEVETIKRDLEKRIIGLTVSGVDVYDHRVLKASKQSFIKKLRGQTFKSIQRRAKAIVITFESGLHMVVQVKMTGHLLYSEENLRKSQSLNDTKVVIALSNGDYLNYNDQRLFGWLILTDNLGTISYLNSVGPEPLEGDFNIPWLKDELKKRKAPIKTLLLNQNFLAGIGNIYASEILFSAGISPKKPSKRLSHNQIERLHEKTIVTLKEAIKYRGTSMRNYRDTEGKKGSFMNRIKVYGRENQDCFNCHKPIKRIVQSGRSTFYCQSCQV